MVSRKIVLFTVFTLLLFSSSLFAGVKNYTNGNAILSLAVDGNTLLAGTQGGVVEWNLKKKTYRKITTLEALPNNKITSIVVDKKKGIRWFATHRGVAMYDGKKWTSYGVKNGLNSMWINHLYLDDEGIIWAASRRGVNWFDNYQWNSLFENKENDPGRVYGMAKTGKEQWWFTDRGKGIFLLSPTFELTTYKRIHDIPSLYTRRVTIDQNGTTWFATYRGVLSHDGKTWRRYEQTEGLTSLQINEIFIDHANTPWVGTTHGASRYVDGKWTPLDLKSLNHYVTAIAEDEEGNIYLGTKDGIGIYNGKKITILKTKDPTKGVAYTDAVMQSDGTLWFSATEAGGILSFNGRKWRHYGKNDGLSDNNVLCLAVDEKDSLWAGTHHGVFRLVSGKWEPVTGRDTPANKNVYTIAFQEDKTLFGSSDGLSIHQNNQWTTFTKKDGLPGNTVLSLFVDNDRTFIGTLSGLAVLEDEKLSPIEALNGYPVASIQKTDDGTLYAGTDSGLFEIKNEKIRRLGISDGLFDLRVQDLYLDDQRHLWVATQRGLCKYDGEHFESYTRDHGFADDHINAVVVDQKGHKWLATTQGITRFDEWLKFDYMKYIGLAQKAILTLNHNQFNKDPGKREKISVVIKNLTNNKKTKIYLKENGVNSDTFQGELTFSPDPHSNKKRTLQVEADKTNLIFAKISQGFSEPITTRAFWQNDFTTGNINGDAIISWRDAILADKADSGLVQPQKLIDLDYDKNSIIDQKDVKYAKDVTIGMIHPWDMAENNGAPLKPSIASHTKKKHKMFFPKDLPWIFKRIKASEGGVLELENLTLEIPPNALEQDTVITMIEGGRTPSPSVVGVYPVGPGFNLYPAGLTFKKPVKITLRIDKSDLKKAGVSDLLALSLGQWNGKGYDALPSYPYFLENKIVGFAHQFPDNLQRPNRPANAKTRTAPVVNYLFPSNYFTLITIEEKDPVIIHQDQASELSVKLKSQGALEPFRFFLIDGKEQKMLLDVDQVQLKTDNIPLHTVSKHGTLLTDNLNGNTLNSHTPYRAGVITKDRNGNKALLSSTFYIQKPEKLLSLKILPEKVSLAENATFRFIGLGISQRRTELPGLDLAWSTKNPRAIINSSGVLSVKGEEHGKIQSTYANLTASAEYQASGKPILTNILMAPKVQVIRVNEQRDYQAAGVDQYGHRLEFKPEWKIESQGGLGDMDSKTGHFKAKKEGIFFVEVKGDPNVSERVISFIGACTWCHFKGK